MSEMAEPIGPGDWVECVNSKQAKRGARIDRGDLYCVDTITQGLDIIGGGIIQGLVLTEPKTRSMAPSGVMDGWRPEHFRPIYTPKQSLIESLRTVSRDQVLA